MIDPREIRAGNWFIKIKGTNSHQKPLFEYKAIAVDDYYYRLANVYLPIRITPDILGKSGFKHEFGDWYLNRPVEGIDDGLPFLRYRHNDHCWYLGKTKLLSQPLFLHQLQNLIYALTKDELDVHLGRLENPARTGPVEFFVAPLQINNPLNTDIIHFQTNQ